jgi:hypothetical protein
MIKDGEGYNILVSGVSRNFEKGGPLLKGGPTPRNIKKNHIFWVSNLEFY